MPTIYFFALFETVLTAILSDYSAYGLTSREALEGKCDILVDRLAYILDMPAEWVKELPEYRAWVSDGLKQY